MRYSDDFIIVLPHVEEVTAISALIEISDLFNSPNYPGLELQPSKTQYYHFQKTRQKIVELSFTKMQTAQTVT